MKVWLRTMFLVLFMCLALPTSFAFAESSSVQLDLTPSDETIVVGDKVDLDAQATGIEGEVDWDWSTNGSGEITDKNDGTASYIASESDAGKTVTFTVTVTTSEEEITDTCSVTVSKMTFGFSESSITLYDNQSKEISIPIDDFNFDLEEEDEITFSSSNTSVASVSKNSDSKITIKANAAGSATIYMKVNHNGIEETDSVTVKVIGTKFAKSNYAVAKGYTIATALSNASGGDSITSITYKSSNTSYVTVNSTTGVIKGVTYGKTAVITATMKLKDGSTVSYQTNAVVTNPAASKSTFTVAKGKSITLTLTGTSSYSVKKFTSAKSSYAKITKASTGKCKGVKSGKRIKITVWVDGKTFNTYVYVSNPHLSDNKTALQKGKKSTLSILGLSSKYSSTVKYTSGNSEIVTVTSSGKLKGKKYGSTVVYATVDGKTVSTIVTVGTKKAVGAFNAAKKAIGCTYSQPKRMRSGYRDCSSMVWRAYKTVGIKMGTKVNWAPTAAAQAYYFNSHKKIIYRKKVSYTKLRVGDLIYYTYGTNHRYKNIGHVAMYVGDGYIIHASGSAGKVCYAEYNNLKSHIVMIARPSK